MIFLSLYVFVRSLTWRARHSQPPFATRLCFLFCNQLASARLVIRRAVEMESLQFVGCSWFIGLIGLVSDSPEIKVPKPNYVCIYAHPLSPLAHT